MERDTKADVWGWHLSQRPAARARQSALAHPEQTGTGLPRGALLEEFLVQNQMTLLTML
jgi:hypothetical protein